jgi:hypothetical protein
VSSSKAQQLKLHALVRFVVDLLYNQLYSKSPVEFELKAVTETDRVTDCYGLTATNIADSLNFILKCLALVKVH